MRILFVGDIDGRPGRTALANALPALREEWQGFDFVVVNCENAAAGKGMTGKILEEFLALGVDGMTSGNHIWDKNAFYPILNEETRVLRPANYPPECPGTGVTVLRRNGKKLGLINLQGRVFMPPIDCPFHCADALLEELRAKEGDALPVPGVDDHAGERLEAGVQLHRLAIEKLGLLELGRPLVVHPVPIPRFGITPFLLHGLLQPRVRRLVTFLTHQGDPLPQGGDAGTGGNGLFPGRRR